ncbi:MAG TPA: 3D domain-containing protein [Patescibacteria group bacterium]|nr:3D domain-containing protein [Patescibacteria group bacterium]
MSFNPQIRERVAAAAVHSVLILLLAGGVGYLFNHYQPLAKQNQVARGATTVCPGTKLNYPRVIKETIRGKRFSFRYNCIQSGFLATSYDGNCKGCSGRTRLTNEPVTWGVCAVDTDVIRPYKDTRSQFYVPGYGPCRAADTGGKIKGKRIDLGFEDISKGWWSKRYTDIYTFVK